MVDLWTDKLSSPNHASTPRSSALNHQWYPKPANSKTGFQIESYRGEDMFTWPRVGRDESSVGEGEKEWKNGC